ncbi:MAG: hypothetical protein ACAH83_08870 [Alphaproteobacteria bacterium]
MAFIRKLALQICTSVIAGVALLTCLSLSSLLHAEGVLAAGNQTAQSPIPPEQVPAPPIPKPCNPIPSTTIAPIFQRLKAINLFISYPVSYRRAIECHDNQSECLKRASGYGLPDFDSGEYLHRFEKLYDTYPRALSPDTVTTLFRNNLKQAFAGVLPHDKLCHIPEPLVLPEGNVSSTDVSNPDALTVTIVVSIIDTVEPHIAVFSGTAFRYGVSNYGLSIPYSIAIPFDLPQDKIRERLEGYLLFVQPRSPSPGNQ